MAFSYEFFTFPLIYSNTSLLNPNAFTCCLLCVSMCLVSFPKFLSILLVFSDNPLLNVRNSNAVLVYNFLFLLIFSSLCFLEINFVVFFLNFGG